MLVATNCQTVLQYASKVFIIHICSKAVNMQRIDVVWDCLFQDSLKSEKINNWVAEVRTEIFGNGKIINNWTKSLLSSDNKSELFPFSSTQIFSGALTNKIVVAT